VARFSEPRLNRTRQDQYRERYLKRSPPATTRGTDPYTHFITPYIDLQSDLATEFARRQREEDEIIRRGREFKLLAEVEEVGISSPTRSSSLSRVGA
jgi:hypothetical protein